MLRAPLALTAALWLVGCAINTDPILGDRDAGPSFDLGVGDVHANAPPIEYDGCDVDWTCTEGCDDDLDCTERLVAGEPPIAGDRPVGEDTPSWPELGGEQTVAADGEQWIRLGAVEPGERIEADVADGDLTVAVYATDDGRLLSRSVAAPVVVLGEASPAAALRLVAGDTEARFTLSRTPADAAEEAPADAATDTP